MIGLCARQVTHAGNHQKTKVNSHCGLEVVIQLSLWGYLGGLVTT